MRRSLICVLTLSSVFVLSGCVVRTYQVTKDRVDQDVSVGNRGYLMGQPPKGAEIKERKPTRQTQVVEIELRSPIKFERLKKGDSAKMESKGVSEGTSDYSGENEMSAGPALSGTYKSYTVQEGDTLQKISKKFYGTTKKWGKIFDANSSSLKAANKIYPGQTLNIPVEEMKETEENLK